MSKKNDKNGGKGKGADEKNNNTKKGKSPDRGKGKKDEYKVGYGKPPKQYQFPKGTSGNLRGRPTVTDAQKSMRMSLTTLREFVMAEAWKHVTVTEDGERCKIPMIQAIIKRLNTEALKGNVAAAKLSTQIAISAISQNDKELHEWIVSWRALRASVLKAGANPGSLNHYEVMYGYYMLKKDIRAIEGEGTWPYEDEEPIFDEDWHYFLSEIEKLRKDPEYKAPWPPRYPSNEPNHD